MQFLLAHGHRQIGFVGASPEAYPSLRERREGYAQAMRGVAGTYSADCAINTAAAAEATRALVAAHPAIAALFGCDDELAIVAMQAAQALGRQVPQAL